MSMMKVECLVHDVLQARDIKIVSAARVKGIPSAMQRHSSCRLIVQFSSLNQKYKLLRQAIKLKNSV